MIPLSFLINFAKYICIYLLLTKLSNFALKQGIFPSVWKIYTKYLLKVNLGHLLKTIGNLHKYRHIPNLFEVIIRGVPMLFTEFSNAIVLYRFESNRITQFSCKNLISFAFNAGVFAVIEQNEEYLTIPIFN